VGFAALHEIADREWRVRAMWPIRLPTKSLLPSVCSMSEFEKIPWNDISLFYKSTATSWTFKK
jgi:hypothetical protein